MFSTDNDDFGQGLTDYERRQEEFRTRNAYLIPVSAGRVVSETEKAGASLTLHRPGAFGGNQEITPTDALWWVIRQVLNTKEEMGPDG